MLARLVRSIHDCSNVESKLRASSSQRLMRVSTGWIPLGPLLDIVECILGIHRSVWRGGKRRRGCQDVRVMVMNKGCVDVKRKNKKNAQTINQHMAK